MSTASIREALLAKKAEIEAALSDLDRIEALAGLRDDLEAVPCAKSNSQKVLESISKVPKSIREISEEVELSESQVYHALTSHRLRRIVRPIKIENERMYAMKTWKPGQHDDESEIEQLSLTDAIVDLLREHGKPMPTVEVANALLGKVETTATNFHGTVASTLSGLVKSGRAKRVPGEGYTLRRLFDALKGEE